MSAIEWLPSRAAPVRAFAAARRHGLETGWGVLLVACHVAMVAWPEWHTIPFYLVWISLAVIYGLRVWKPRTTVLVLAMVSATTASALGFDVVVLHQDWRMLIKVPLMAMLFSVIVWQARARAVALRASEHDARELQAALERQERFIHDASHELKTPVTIARGHLELLRRRGQRDIRIALEELGRIEAILGQLLLLAAAGQPDFLRPEPVDVEPFMEDLFIRWCEVAPRNWRLGPVVQGTVRADPERLRTALDALLDNAVKYSDAHSAIELRARWGGNHELVIEVEDEGVGISKEALGRIFARFGRADTARTRSEGGAGLGLAIVDAIAEQHRGRRSVQSGPRGSVFALHLPLATPPKPGTTTEASQRTLSHTGH